eukprot:TRINITY_DN732_c0_g1_i1.p1 TRINITY_DN732_c0_g1~~TRINITY_DN732_c0_g1_i1.p1  ORF type:complete len:447 (-),score=56.59 TRINITY_DN732_c0_g1_i1:185-1525(-)
MLAPRQLRTCHITEISARNLKGGDECYLVLRSLDDDSIIYQSETKAKCQNPDWYISIENRVCKEVKLQILVSEESKEFKVTIEEDIILSELKSLGRLDFYVKDQINRCLVDLPLNSVFLRINKCLHTKSNLHEAIIKTNKGNRARNESSSGGRTYHIPSAMASAKRMLLCRQNTLSIESLTNEMKQKIADLIVKKRKRAEQKASIIRRRRETLAKREELKDIDERLQRSRKAMMTHSKNYKDTLTSLTTQIDELPALKEKLVSIKRSINNKRYKPALARLNLFVEARQAKLCHQMSQLFPIVPVPKRQSWAIRGKYLPANPSAGEPLVVGAAMGFVVQVVKFLVKLFEIPVRCELEFLGSRSTIREKVGDLAINPPSYPLFPRNQDRSRFQVGVAMLTKTIAQIAHSRGVMMRGTSLLEVLHRIICDATGETVMTLPEVPKIQGKR